MKRSSEHCALVTSTPSPWSSSWLHLGWVGTAPREAEIPSPSQKGPSGLHPCLEQKEREGERNRRSYVGSILLKKPPGCIFYPGKKYFFSNRQVNSFCQNTSLLKKVRRIELEGHGRDTEEIKQRLFRGGTWFNTLWLSYPSG